MQRTQTATHPVLRQGWSDEIGLARAARVAPMAIPDDLRAILDGEPR